MKSRTQLLVLLISIIIPFFYFCLLTILGFMWDGYDPISTGMSELGAIDSPFKVAMNYFGFSLLGLSIIAFSYGFKAYFSKDSQSKIVFILLLLGGISLLLVGFLPCDSGCVDITLTGKLHSISSTIPALLLPIAAMFSALPVSKKWGKRWGLTSFSLGVISMSAGPVMFIQVISDFSGLVQRLGIGLSLLWIVLLSINILNDILR